MTCLGPLDAAFVATILSAVTRRAKTGGPERDQTADLVVANDALYQLSYRPQKET